MMMNQNTQHAEWGARLKAAREAMNLTEKDVATRLYLNSKIITILENETFENSPPLTFMRGYLRSYARLLNFTDVDIDQAIQQLDKTFPQIAKISSALQTERLDSSNPFIQWMTYGIVLVLIVLVGVWWSSHTNQPSTNSIVPDTTVPTANAIVTQPAPAQPTAAPVETPAPTPVTPPQNTILPVTTPVAPAPQTVIPGQLIPQSAPVPAPAPQPTAPQQQAVPAPTPEAAIPAPVPAPQPEAAPQPPAAADNIPPPAQPAEDDSPIQKPIHRHHHISETPAALPEPELNLNGDD